MCQVSKGQRPEVDRLAFYGIKIVLVQAHIALEDVAVGDATANGVSRVNKSIAVDALAVYSDESQTSVLAQIVGLFLMSKSGIGAEP